MKKALIVYNPNSGMKLGDKYIERIVERLKEFFDQVIVHKTQSEEDMKRVVRDACKEEFHSIFIGSGDGGINLCVNEIYKENYRPIIGVIPFGTVNNLATMLGFSTILEIYIEELKNLEVFDMDLGQVNGQKFITSVTFGPLIDFSHEVSEDRKSKEGVFAFFKEGISTISDERTARFNMEVDQELMIEDLSLGIVGLGNSLARFQKFFPNASLDDGYLNFAGLRKSHSLEKIAIIPEIFMDEDFKNEKVVQTQAKHMLINCCEDSSDVSIKVDGDEGQEFPLEISIIKKALKFYRKKQ